VAGRVNDYGAVRWYMFVAWIYRMLLWKIELVGIRCNGAFSSSDCALLLSSAGWVSLFEAESERRSMDNDSNVSTPTSSLIRCAV